MNSVDDAVEFLNAALIAPPITALILGSGLSGLAKAMDDATRLPFAEIPGFPRSTAIGHKGEFVVGRLGNRSVVAINGRLHAYEGHTDEQIGMPLRVMHRLGATRLIVSNATGGLNPRFRAGDLMVIDSDLDLMFRPPVAMPDQKTRIWTARCGNGTRSTYDPDLVGATIECARRLAIPLHRGVYVGLLGPNYETRAEYRFLRRFGGDVVGMSTICETRLAGCLGMSVLGLSVVTNVASPDCLTATTGDEVIAVARSAESRMQRLVSELIDRL